MTIFEDAKKYIHNAAHLDGCGVYGDGPQDCTCGLDALQALRSLPTDDGVTDEMVEAAYHAWMNYDGSKNWDTRDVLRLALEAALGPLPAPPTIEGDKP